MVICEHTDIYRAFYTKSETIVNYMIKRLEVLPHQRVLEPCAGDGVFIDAILKTHPDIHIDAYELHPQAMAKLHQKYTSFPNVKCYHDDTLINSELFLYANMGGIYDRIIANPPYGAWQDYEKRELLKNLFDGIYVKETYALFLYRCIQLLREDGRLVFILPDTFLHLHMHTRLREFILRNTQIIEIAIFPPSFFPGISFGYGELCIITLSKKTGNGARQPFRLRRFSSISELAHDSGNLKDMWIGQDDVYRNIDHALFITHDNTVSDLINRAQQRIGEIAACVTGIYSGNDTKYLRPISAHIKNSRKYQIVDPELISTDYLNYANPLDGIEGPKCFIPIMKGSGVKYFKPTSWYIDWGQQAVSTYRSDKRARFQNSNYYFKRGIGVPMVSSSQVTAALIEQTVFDQSIVGIFPYAPKLTNYLLAFFNSPTSNALIQTINPSANNSSNYIKKIPFIHPGDDVLAEIDALINRILNALKSNNCHISKFEKELSRIIKSLYGF